jgi:two-component system chemotaxis response regulator CheB
MTLTPHPTNRPGAADAPGPSAGRTGHVAVRVLLVDDSVVIRRMLTDVLSDDPDIEVIGSASNGRLALQRLALGLPDVVVMDVEMPVMSGLETLPELRRLYPKLPVIMFSTLTTRGGQATLDALSLGASDYVAKPANMASIGESIEKIKAELTPKVKALGGGASGIAAKTAARPPTAAPSAPRLPGLLRLATEKVEAVVIGVSTGGPSALQDIVPKLPPNLPVPIFVVQHMPALFTKLLAARLDATSAIRVFEATDGQGAEPGTLYIAPGDHHMVLERKGNAVRVTLNQDAPENSCRPAVDPLFRSAADVYGAGVLAVVLTGMGSDGCAGAGVIVAAGGQCFAQDETTSVVWGMPGFVTRAGHADRNVPLGEVAAEIVRRCSAGRAFVAAPSGARAEG